MLFFVFVALLAVGMILMYKSNDCMLEGIGFGAMFIGICAVLVSIVAFGINYIGVDGYVARMNTRYDTLVYQYENDIYDNDNDLGKRELIKDIQNWNEDLSARRERQDDFWIGIFVPNIYDQFEFIQLVKE